MVRRLALDAGVEESAVRRWLDRGHCDEIGTRLLKALHRSAMPETMPARFAVGFTSVLAGVLLAAETIKIVLGRPLARESSSMNNITFQFFKPTASANAAMSLARDPLCIACDPTGTGTAVWRRRSHRLTAMG